MLKEIFIGMVSCVLAFAIVFIAMGVIVVMGGEL